MANTEANWQLDLPGVPTAVPERNARERSIIALDLYAKASANFERFSASLAEGGRDLEAERRWMEYRKRADMVLNGLA